MVSRSLFWYRDSAFCCSASRSSSSWDQPVRAFLGLDILQIGGQNISIPKRRSKNLDTPKKTSRYQLKESEGPKGGLRKGGRGRKLSHFSFCCAFRCCCVVYSPCFPVWGEEKVMTIYDAGPLAAGPLCGLLKESPENKKVECNPGRLHGKRVSL